MSPLVLPSSSFVPLQPPSSTPCPCYTPGTDSWPWQTPWILLEMDDGWSIHPCANWFSNQLQQGVPGRGSVELLVHQWEGRWTSPTSGFWLRAVWHFCWSCGHVLQPLSKAVSLGKDCRGCLEKHIVGLVWCLEKHQRHAWHQKQKFGKAPAKKVLGKAPEQSM